MVRAATGSCEGVAVELARVAAALAGDGLTEPMVREAVENWVSLGVMGMEHGRVMIVPGSVCTPPVTASLPPPATGAQVPGPRPVALLSLFDGTGMARLGLDDLLRMAGAPQALVCSAFAELDDELATAVERRWQAHAALGMGGAPCAGCPQRMGPGLWGCWTPYAECCVESRKGLCC